MFGLMRRSKKEAAERLEEGAMTSQAALVAGGAMMRPAEDDEDSPQLMPGSLAGVGALPDPEPIAEYEAAPIDQPERRKRRFSFPLAKASSEKSEPEEMSVPTMVVIDYYQGLAKRSEAEQLARAFIEQHFTSPNACYLFYMRWRNGMAIEIQQGGGRAFLPEVLAKIDAEPDAVVAVPASNRVIQVSLNHETGALETLLLPAQQGAPEGAHLALPGPGMSPFDRRGIRLAMAGGAAAVVCGAAAFLSMFSFFLDKESWAAPYLKQSSVSSLPISTQAQEAIASALKQGDCVYRLEYNGTWQAKPGWASSGVCVGTKAAGSPSAVEPPPAAGALPPVPGQPVPPVAAPSNLNGTSPAAALPGSSPAPVAMPPSAVPAQGGQP